MEVITTAMKIDHEKMLVIAGSAGVRHAILYHLFIFYILHYIYINKSVIKIIVSIITCIINNGILLLLLLL